MTSSPRRLVLVALAAALTVGAATRARAETAAGRPIGDPCDDDKQCAVGAICEQKICTALPKGRRVIPFYFHQPGEVGHRYVPPALYFSKWDRDKTVRVQFPFYAGVIDKKEQTSTHIVPPIALWWTKWGRGGDGGTSVGWMPFFYATKHGAVGEKTTTVALPLFLTGARVDEKRDFSEGMVALLGYWRRERDRAWRVAFPLFWDRQTATKRTTTLLPFFVWDRDDDAGRKQLVLLTPPFYHRRDAEREIDFLLPIFFRWKNRRTDSTVILAGPVYHHGDRDGSTSSVFPLWWRFSDRRTKSWTQFLVPVAAFHGEPGRRWGFVGPFFGWGNERDRRPDGTGGGWGVGLLPFFYAGRTDATRYGIVAPVFAYARDQRAGSTTVQAGPVYAHTTKTGFDAGVAPVAFFGSRDGGKSSYAVVPPLLFVHRKTPEAQTDVVGPVYVKRKSNGDYAAGVAPILFFGRSGTKSHQVFLPPLFVRTADDAARKERVLVTLFYHRRDGDETADVLFPLLYLRRSPTRSLFISPLGGFRREGQKETLVVGPYGSIVNPAAKRDTRWFFPLFVRHRQPGYNVTVAFPIFWRIQDRDETDTAVFPFYWRVRSPRMQLDGVFPIFLHTKTAVATTTIVGPFWNRVRTDGANTRGLIPLFVSGRMMLGGGKSFRYVGGPLFGWSKNEEKGTRTVVVGPFFDHRSPDGYTAGLAPLAFAWKRGSVSRALILPLFYRQSDKATDSSLNVLLTAYWGHVGAQKRFGLAPLLFVSTKSEGEGTFRATLFPLFYAHKKTTGSTVLTALFGWSTSAAGGRGYVTPLIYWRKDNQVTSGALWPIVYFGKDRAAGTTTRYVFPFYFHWHDQDARAISAYTPLVWHYRSVERNLVTVAGLFWDSHIFKEQRVTGIFPLFFRDRRFSDNSTSFWIPPLLTWARVRRTGENPGTDLVVLPLIYHFGGTERSRTVVFPVWWDWKTGEDRTQVFFPIGAHLLRSDWKHVVVLNTWVRKGRGDNAGAWYVHIIPIVDFGRPRKGDVEFNILEGLIGYRRMGRNRILRLFWGWDIPLEPAPASSLGWWSNTPPSARTSF